MLMSRKGELITELCFVVAGSLEVVQDGEILAFLGRLLEPSILVSVPLGSLSCLKSLEVVQDREILAFLLALSTFPPTGMMCAGIQTGKNQNKVQATFQCTECNIMLILGNILNVTGNNALNAILMMLFAKC